MFALKKATKSKPPIAMDPPDWNLHGPSSASWDSEAFFGALERLRAPVFPWL